MFQHSNKIVKYLQIFNKQILISITFIIILFTSIGLMTTTKSPTRLSTSIFSSWTSQVDQSIFVILFGVENKGFDLNHQITNESPSISEVLFNIAISIKLNDLKSFLAHEMPGFSAYENTIIIAGEGIEDTRSLS